MSTWNVFLAPRAHRQWGRLPAKLRRLADLAIRDLEVLGPVPRGWDVRKTADREYRLRLTYRYRMRYRLLGAGRLEIEVFYVGHRRDAYR